MKNVLRAIGGFFAKIGRWIANTAWIQPLLIVGGIFAVIFSIPYIKSAIENAQIDTTDYDYAYYTSSDHKLGLEKDGKAEKLIQYLGEDDSEEKFSKINSAYGSKFFLAFVKKDCDACKECVEGYKYFESHKSELGYEGNFKLWTIVVDETDEDDEKTYLAKDILKRNIEFFDKIAASYGEESASSSYALYKNVDSIASTYRSNCKDLPKSILEDSNGITTPTIFMYDYEKIVADPTCLNVSGVTAVLYDYTQLVTGEKNNVTKGQLLRDCWNYGKVFDPEYEGY